MSIVPLLCPIVVWTYVSDVFATIIDVMYVFRRIRKTEFSKNVALFVWKMDGILSTGSRAAFFREIRARP
jgi:hypothetical protein